jgi:hypothetical protein
MIVEMELVCVGIWKWVKSSTLWTKNACCSVICCLVFSPKSYNYIFQWQSELCLKITIVSCFHLERHHESVASSFSPQRTYSSSPVSAGKTLNNAPHNTGVLISNVYIAFQLEGFRWLNSHLILWCFPYETKAWHILNINQWLKPR